MAAQCHSLRKIDGRSFAPLCLQGRRLEQAMAIFNLAMKSIHYIFQAIFWLFRQRFFCTQSSRLPGDWLAKIAPKAIRAWTSHKGAQGWQREIALLVKAVHFGCAFFGSRFLQKLIPGVVNVLGVIGGDFGNNDSPLLRRNPAARPHSPCLAK